jgi:hypothetical protein
MSDYDTWVTIGGYAATVVLYIYAWATGVLQ